MAKKNKTAAVAAAASTIAWGTKSSETSEVLNIPLNKVVVVKGANPRTVFKDEDQEALVKQIKSIGLITPITVKPGEKDGSYILVDGERRRRAFQAMGRDTIPAIVRTDLDDVESKIIALTMGSGENSVPLTNIERGLQYDKLIKEHKLSPEDIAKRVGVHKRTVQRDLELVSAPPDVIKLVEEGRVSASAALELNKNFDAKDRKRIVDELGDDLTEVSIKRRAKQEASAQVDKTEGKTTKSKGKKHNRSKGNQRSAHLIVPRSRKTISSSVTLCCYHLLSLRDSGKKKDTESEAYLGLFATTYTLLWASGEFADEAIFAPMGDVAEDEVEPNAEAREERLKAFWKRVEYHAAIAKRAQEEEEKRAEKLAKKNAKNSKKDSEAEDETDAEEDVDGEEEETEDSEELAGVAD